MISIHALRVEGDDKRKYACVVNSLFQSTPSVWRATKSDSPVTRDDSLFQSTPSVWRATASIREKDIPCFISIHALRVEGDLSASRAFFDKGISIHALRVEGDQKAMEMSLFEVKISIHALRVEGDIILVTIAGA